MEQAMGSSEVAGPPSDAPTLAAELRSSALLLGMAAAIVSSTLLVTRALGA